MVDRTLNYGRDIVASMVRGLDVNIAVDLGPGLGEDLRTVRGLHPEAQVFGLEAHGPYADGLRGAGFDIRTLDVERDPFPFQTETVDLIVANQIFEHVKEVFWILHESARVLRIGGSLVIGVPNLASLHNRILLALGKQPTSLVNRSAHVRGYTRGDLVELMDKPYPGGFRLAAARGANFYPLPRGLARIGARIWPGGAWGFFGRFEKVGPYRGEFLKWPISEALETNFYVGPERPS